MSISDYLSVRCSTVQQSHGVENWTHLPVRRNTSKCDGVRFDKDSSVVSGSWVGPNCSQLSRNFSQMQRSRSHFGKHSPRQDVLWSSHANIPHSDRVLPSRVERPPAEHLPMILMLVTHCLPLRDVLPSLQQMHLLTFRATVSLLRKSDLTAR